MDTSSFYVAVPVYLCSVGAKNTRITLTHPGKKSSSQAVSMSSNRHGRPTTKRIKWGGEPTLTEIHFLVLYELGSIRTPLDFACLEMGAISQPSVCYTAQAASGSRFNRIRVSWLDNGQRFVGLTNDQHRPIRIMDADIKFNGSW